MIRGCGLFVAIVLRRLTYFRLICIERIYGFSSIVNYLRNPDPQLTVKVLRYFGAKIGNGVTIKRSIFIDNSYEDLESAGSFSHLTIGDNCYIGDDVYFDLAKKIVLGKNVVISGRVSFITHADCNRSPFLNQVFHRKSGEINVSNGAWIGFGATILHGVSIGENSVVAACSLQKTDVAPYTLNAGIPSKKIKEIALER